MKKQDHDGYITVTELAAYLRRIPLDTSGHSRSIILDLEDDLHCKVNLSTLTLAALFNNHVVVPLKGGQTFKFVKVD